MLATFCLRLSAGLALALLPLLRQEINPRFFRAQALTILGLATAVLAFPPEAAGWPFWLGLGLGGFFALAGSMSWSIEHAPFARSLLIATFVSLAWAIVAGPRAGHSDLGAAAELAVEFSSAAVLGTSVAAMLLGHAYLTAPGMTLTPLMRALLALAAALAARCLLAGIGLWMWTRDHSLLSLSDLKYLLPTRWALGFLGPLVLTAMAWQTARIRSTQSATGILYVVVIFCFLGEVLGQVVLAITKGTMIP